MLNYSRKRKSRLALCLMLLVLPHTLWAIPPAIARIVRDLEAVNEPKKTKKPVKKTGAVAVAQDAQVDGQVAKEAQVGGQVAKEAQVGGQVAKDVQVGGQVAKDVPVGGQVAKDAQVGISSRLAQPVQALLGTAASRRETVALKEVLLSNLQQLRLRIDEAIKDVALAKHPATWYYRGVIYDRLLRSQIISQEAPVLFNETLASYEKVKALSTPRTQFYSFSLSRIAELWSYYLDRGIRYYEQENYEQAVAYFAICRRILPEEPTPCLYTAIVYHTSHQSEEALRFYQAYLEVHGPCVAAFRAMADIYYHQLKNFDQAIDLLDHAGSLFSFDNELLEEKFLLYKAAGKLDGMEAALCKAIASDQAEVHGYRYAYFLEGQGRREEAMLYYQQILKHQPYSYETLRQLGLLFYNEAIEAHVKVQRLDTQYKHLQHCTHFVNGLGWLSVYVKPLIGKHRYAVFDYKQVNQNGLFLFSPSGTSWTQLPLQSGYTTPVRIVDRVYVAPLLPMGLLYGYVTEKIAVALYEAIRSQVVLKLEAHLRKARHYLKMVDSQKRKNKKRDKNTLQYNQDKMVSQALYYTYYHLRKYGSAHKLLNAMHKRQHYLSQADDPFFVEKDKA